jgi:mannonate dehydratase
MARISRRRFLWLGGGGAVLLGGIGGLYFGLPRLLRPGPNRELGAEAAAFVEECWAGVDHSRVWDTHVHVIGLGAGGSGCWVQPDMLSALHPIKRFQFSLYKSALGMESELTADADYITRMLALLRQANPLGKLLVMAFDQNVDEDGAERPELSPFFTPNAYVLRLAAEHPELIACASIHPYRRDAVERLDEAVEAGARAVKWLPNSMGIDPASPRCDAFYRRMAEADLPLICHAGLEYAAGAAHAQELGNPLRLRRALDAGARVVVAHCASFGWHRDLDAPAGDRPRVAAFDLFMRMMREPQYDGRLFGDISAITQLNRSGRVLRELLEARELHPRLVNGSDYPLLALGFLFSTRKLQFEELIGDRERKLCNEIADVNPLLFDFALKRSLVYESEAGQHRFPATVFETDWLIRGRAGS